MRELAGAVVVITGASGGHRPSHCETRFAAAGANVVLAARHRAGLRAAAREVRRARA